MFNTPWRIVWQLPTEIPTFDAIWSTDFLLLLITISGTCLTFALFVDTEGWPLYGSSSTLSHQSWKHLRQLHSRHFFIGLLPYTCCNMFHVSAGDFWSQTQNLIFFTLLYYSHFQLWCDLTHTKEKSKCCYAFRGYEMAQLFLWWCHAWCQLETEISLMQQFLWIVPANSRHFWSYYRQMSFT